MLTKQQAAFEVDDNGRVIADRIWQKQHPAYPQYGEELLALFKNGIGKTRQELELEAERILDQDQDCPLRRAKAFFKLLEDVSDFDTDKGHKAWKLRKQVMELSAQHHPLKRLSGGIWGKDEVEVKEQIAQQLGKPWNEIEAGLFSDIRQFHPLVRFEGYANAAELLNRYNVAQCQAVLYNCAKLRVEARADFKKILRHAKLARLLHQITRLGDSHYLFEFSGPASVLSDTRRYGMNMAKFLPSLLRCNGWKLEADLKLGRWSVKFTLSPQDQLRPSWPEEDKYDSSLEKVFVEKWGPTARDGWSLSHESEILWKGQHVYAPDFVFNHEGGRRVLFEIAAFWTPEYIEQKKATLSKFKDSGILVAVPEELAEHYRELGARLVVYKSGLKLEPVMEALSAFGS
jgi:predicted nuclease of restriction endonuclease-like RecB superfamily